jgi:hypothetical protein
MNKYYVNQEESRYIVLDTNNGKTYPFLLNIECGLEAVDMGRPSSSIVNLEEYLLVTYDQLVAITRSESILREAKEVAIQAAKEVAIQQASIEAARTSTPEYRLKLALTCLLDQAWRLSDNDSVYDDFGGLSMDLDEIQDICDGIEVVL